MCTLSLPIVLDAPDDKAMIHYGGFPHLVDLVLDYSLCDPPSLLGLKPYSKEWEERCSQVSSDDFSLLRSLGPVCKGWKERISTHMFFSLVISWGGRHLPDKRVEQTLSITAFDKEGRQSFAHEKGFVITKAAPAGTYLMDWILANKDPLAALIRPASVLTYTTEGMMETIPHEVVNFIELHRTCDVFRMANLSDTFYTQLSSLSLDTVAVTSVSREPSYRPPMTILGMLDKLLRYIEVDGTESGCDVVVYKFMTPFAGGGTYAQLMDFSPLVLGRQIVIAWPQKYAAPETEDLETYADQMLSVIKACKRPITLVGYPQALREIVEPTSRIFQHPPRRSQAKFLTHDEYRLLVGAKAYSLQLEFSAI